MLALLGFDSVATRLIILAMYRLVILLVSLAWFAQPSAGAAPVYSPPAATNPPSMQIVTCRDGVDLAALLAEFQIVPTFRWDFLPGFAAPMDAATIRKLKAHDCILAVEADGPMSLCAQTNSTGLVRMGIDRFPVARINGLPKEPLDVDVAILDTGIDPHEELNVVQSYSPFTLNFNDELGHGTSVAGVLGAKDNGSGVVGVAPGVRLWNVKILGPPPYNSWTYLIQGLAYVRQYSNTISIVNLSIGNESTNAPLSPIYLAIRRVVHAGIVVVAAVGNSTNDLAGSDGIWYTGDDFVPAAHPEVMAVSGMDPVADTIWSKSNFSQIERTNQSPFITNHVFSPGGAIDVAAPAYEILSTHTNGGYRVRSGTSLAAPHVAGLVALYIAANGRATNAEGVYRIRQAIIDSSLPQSQWRTNNTLDPDANPEPLAIASENWVPQAAIADYGGAPGGFQVGFAAVPGYDYTLQSATNLTPPLAWADLATVSGTTFVAPATVTDTNVAAQSLYRLARQPSANPP